MSNPVCPTHGVDLKVSKFGGYFCTSFMEDGETRCTYRIKAPKPTSIPGAVPATSLLPKSDSHDVLLAASLDFAATLFKGAGPEMADDVLLLAVKAYQTMKAIG
jgi:hypothetical protein